MKRLAFLYKSCEPACYAFEVFETVRKLILTGGLVFMRPGTAVQIIAAMLLCLGSMRVYAAYKPFIDGEIDILSEGES